MPQNKTVPTDQDPRAFLKNTAHKKRKADSLKLFALFNTWLAEKPVVWGDSIVGYGQYRYNYASGRWGLVLHGLFAQKTIADHLYNDWF